MSILEQERMNTREVCQYLGIKSPLWYRMKNAGETPPEFKIGGKAFYTKPQIDKWFKDRNAEAIASLEGAK